MAQISQTLYNLIAQPYALIDTALSGIRANAKTALMAIVDVDTADYPDVSSLADEDAALEIELALLATFNAAYIASQNLEASTGSLLSAVRTVNDYVITNTAGTETATIKLATWINTTMDGSWTGTDCPDGWALMSADAGYTIDEPGYEWDTE